MGVMFWVREPQKSTEATGTGPPLRLALSRALEGKPSKPPTLASQISRLKIEGRLVIALEPVVKVGGCLGHTLLPCLSPLGHLPSGQSRVGAASSSADHLAIKPGPARGCLGSPPAGRAFGSPWLSRACRAGGEGQLPGSEAGLQKESGSPLAWLTSS